MLGAVAGDLNQIGNREPGVAKVTRAAEKQIRPGHHHNFAGAARIRIPRADLRARKLHAPAEDIQAT
ncbi:hypothetical protein D3C83_315190 [compost metagenome]